MLIGILLIGIAMFFAIRWVVRVTIYGKGLIFPNWARVDRKLMEKRDIFAHYEDSFWWKFSHYFFILLIIGLIAATRYIVLM